MPVAAIYEDGQLRPGKHNVGPYPSTRHAHCHIYAITETQRMKGAPETQFGPCVLADIGPHCCRRERGRRRPRQCHIKTSRVFISHLIAGPSCSIPKYADSLCGQPLQPARLRQPVRGGRVLRAGLSRPG